MDLINFDTLIQSDKDKTPKNHPLVPQHPFRLLMIGGSGSGKTNLLLNLITKYFYFDRIYVYAKCVDSEAKYLMLQDFISKLEEKVNKQLRANSEIPQDLIKHVHIGTFSNTLEDLVPADELNPELYNLIVIDDMCTEMINDKSSHKRLSEHFIRGRKANCSYVYLAHSYFMIPKVMRLNTTDIILFPIDNMREIQAIASQYGGGRVGYEVLARELKKLKRFEFLYLDTRACNVCQYLRKGFNGLFIGN